MLFGKWDWDIAKEVWQEEAQEETLEKVFALWESGASLAEAKKTLSLKKKKRL